MSISFRRRLLASTLFVGAAAVTAPAFAQDTSPLPAPAPNAPVTTCTPGSTDPSCAAGVPVAGQNSAPPGVQSQESTPNAPTDTGAIVVTGSLLRNPNLTTASPVAVISQNEISLRQATNAEQLVRTIPGAVPGIGSNVNNGNGGNATVNLRGLGSNRNLVLLDGQRLVPFGLGGVVDLNNIPLALIERVDVLTGGASTTYGADAISGVVNFVTRSDFAGVDATVTEGLTQDGDGNSLRADATVGGNFADDKGNAVLSIGYQKVKPIYQGDRAYANYALDSFAGTVSGSGTTVPSRLGAITTTNAAGATVRATTATRSVVPSTGLLSSTYTPYNFNPYNIFQTPFQRFNIYGAGHYDITDNITFYTRGLFSKNTVDTIIAPSGAFGLAVTIPYSNPYLPTGVLNTICTGAGLSAAQCAASRAATSTTDPNYRTFSTSLSRRAVEAGPRISSYETTVFDYHAGLRGDITDNLHWDVNGSYGESEQVQQISGYTINSRVANALLATNTTSCLNTDGGTCVPLNIFGASGSITPAMLGYIVDSSVVRTKTSLAQAHGQLTGEIPFTSPIADDPISFAVGGEYRRYFASQLPDVLSRGNQLGGSGGPVPAIAGGYSVYEGFGEVDAPIIQNKPLFQQFDIQAGIRESHYDIETTGSPSFTTTTWKAQANWQPVRDIKLRGGYSHSVRAPNIGELFTPQTVGLTNLATDPCAGAAPTTNANLAAVCIAQGAPADLVRSGSIENPSAGQANDTYGGNPNLKPEKSNSFTGGVVLQPTFLPGFTATVDYYHIKITDAVSAPTVQDVIGACFNNLSAASATSTACTGIRRNPSTGALDGTGVAGLPQLSSNLGTLLTDGIDVTANYTHNFGVAKLNLSFAGNWTNRSTFKATPTSINRECVGYYSVNCGSLQPRYSWNQRTTVTIKDIDFSLEWRHISSFKHEPLDVADDGLAYGEGGAIALPAATVAQTGYTGTYNFGRIKAFNYLNYATRFGVNENLDLTLTVNNLLNKKPPIVGYDIGSTSFNSGNTYPSTYDALGRAFLVSAHVKF